MIGVVAETAKKILAQQPGPVIQYRLLRDVLIKPSASQMLMQAKDNLKHSQNIRQLADEQRVDGGWGPFHSQNTQLKQRIPTTEIGVERALSLGLDASQLILQKASAYILAIMQGDIDFPDYHEKNDRWQIGMRMFLASTLAFISPEHPVLDNERNLWHSILKRAFQTGNYSEQGEIDAHRELTGATVKDSYLVLNNKYQLNIIGSKPGMLSVELETALLQWLWNISDGIGYLGVPLHKPPPVKKGPFDRWLRSLEMLSRLFPNWVFFARPAIEWLWKKRNAQGFWDFGSRPNSIAYLPLSDNWHIKMNRVFDWTTRVLILLRKFCNEVS